MCSKVISFDGQEELDTWGALKTYLTENLNEDQLGKMVIEPAKGYSHDPILDTCLCQINVDVLLKSAGIRYHKDVMGDYYLSKIKNSKDSGDKMFVVARILIEPIMGSGERVTLLVAAYNHDGILIERAWDWESDSLECLYELNEKIVLEYWMTNKDLIGMVPPLAGSHFPMQWVKTSSLKQAVKTVKSGLVFLNRPGIVR